MNLFSSRMNTMPVSFLREILKAASSQNVISFAGGLPDESLFPKTELKNASSMVFESHGEKALQYTITEGYQPLREWIASRYNSNRNLKVSPSEILITSGSQQALDLIGKVFLNKGDTIVMEGPGYLGAIQAFSAYEPEFITVPISGNGMDLRLFKESLIHQPKFLYLGSSFQNPTGFSYSEAIKKELALQSESANTFIVEDDAYGELSFDGQYRSLIKQFNPDKTILLGSFSKIISPGLRIGWIVAREDIIKKLTLAKQATDLHSSNFNQMMIYQYLSDNDLDKHISKLRIHYKDKMELLHSSLTKALSSTIKVDKPDGGMFLYLNLPSLINIDRLLKKCFESNLIFVPGKYFYPNPDASKCQGMRINFSCVNTTDIINGGALLSDLINNEINTSY